MRPGSPQGLQHGGTVTQKTELIGHGGLTLSHPQGGLLLGETPQLHEAREALRLLNEVQVPALEIFHQSRNSGLTLVHAHKQTWDLLQTGNFRRPQPPLSGNELITGPNPAHGQRLQNAVLEDAGGQLLEAGLLEDLPGLGWVGPDGPDGEKHHPAGLHIGFQFSALQLLRPPW